MNWHADIPGSLVVFVVVLAISAKQHLEDIFTAVLFPSQASRQGGRIR